MKNKQALTFDRLRELLDYDPVTGIFRWLVDRPCRGGKLFAGSVAGASSHHGYISIGLDGRQYYAHRLAWFWMLGAWPEGSIDHQDGRTSNNVWKNLRAALHTQNMRNRGKQKNNSCGFKGVIKVGDRFRGQLSLGGIHHHLGTFATAELAHAAYCSAAARLHGEFARTA